MSDYASMIVNHTHQESAHNAKLWVGRHLREEHGWGRRRLARYLGTTEKWVREYVEGYGN
jgi:hypothetical protein